MTPPLVNVMGVVVAMITSERLYKRDVLPSVFESMVEEIGDLVIATDNMDRVIFINSGARNITKLENHGFLTHYIWDFFPSLTIDSGDRVQTLTADGKTYDVQHSYLQDWQHHNRPKVYVLRDVTELIDYQNNLEELVEAKSKALMQTERMAAIGETTLMVGHDLRNPLQVLKFLTHEIKKMNASGRTETTSSLLEKMDSNVNYMDKIVSDLSLYARNRQPTKQSTVLIELLESCLVKINVPSDIFIDYDFDFQHEVYVDPYMIERVFNNLILNAVQAISDGGVIRIQALKKNGSDVISVTDTGTGIPAHIQENMFKPLNTSKPKGVGMGLAVCKKIVNLHEGTITVDQTVLDGACFVIEMPESQY
jgi:signal transduction histidine kinase